MALDDLYLAAAAATDRAAARQAAEDSGTDVGQTSQAPIWVAQSNPYPTAPRGAPGARRYTSTPNDMATAIAGMAGNPNSPAFADYTADLIRIGALYSEREARYLPSVLEANQRAVAMYRASGVAGDMPFIEWLSGAARAGADPPSSSSGGGGYSGGYGGGGAYSGPVSSVTLTNEFDARALADGALNNFLGRDATKKERENFYKRLNAKEAENPNVATPTGQTGDVRTGGFNREQFAEDFAKSRDDYAETQAATTLMGWMQESLTNDTRMV